MDGTESIGMEPIDVSNVNWWIVVAVVVGFILLAGARKKFLNLPLNRKDNKSDTGQNEKAS
jgi:hypothetical protein